MTALLVVALLAAPPVASPGAVAFERLKKLEGNWRSAEGRVLSVRVLSGGLAVVGSLTGPAQALLSVTVFHLEGGELVGVHNGAARGLLRLSASSERLLKLEARPEGAKATLVALGLAFKEAERLTLSITTRVGAKDVEESTDFKREYLETLK
jgi:hypothetical protein